MARDRSRWFAAGIASGRAADGRQSPGPRGICRSRSLPRPRGVRPLRNQVVRGDVFRTGDHAKPGRAAQFRSREMRVLRRLCVELSRERRGAAQFAIPRRRGRAALGRELVPNISQENWKQKMTTPYHVVVCASVVPDPLQTLEPITGPSGPALKNEMMLPAILDPWASHALYEGANLVKHIAGSKLWLVSMAPKAKLQQVMMTVAQKVPLQLVAVDGPSSGFADAHQTAHALAAAIRGIAGIDLSRLLLFGGWESKAAATDQC